MADEKISQLAAATSFSPSDFTVVVQGGVSKSLAFSVLHASPFAIVGNSSAGAEIRLPEDTDNGSNYVALKAPDSLAANITWTLPSTDGTSGYALVTNGSGQLSWAASGGAAAPLTLASGTITADSNALSITQTWNNAGVTFSGALKINVTDTASDAASLLMDIQAGGASQFNVRKDGRITINGPSSGGAYLVSTAQYRTGAVLIGADNGAGGGGVSFGSDTLTAVYGACGANGFIVPSDKYYSWASSSIGASPDLIINRNAAGIMGLRGTSDSVGGALNLLEQTAPSAPGSNQVVIYAEDNGSGKTRLMAKFNTGSAVQIAIEP